MYEQYIKCQIINNTMYENLKNWLEIYQYLL